MRKFYFHLHNGHGFTRDEEGQDFEEFATALAQAFQEVRALIAADIENGQPIKMSSYLAIHDAGNNEIGRVRYDEAIVFD